MALNRCLLFQRIIIRSNPKQPELTLYSCSKNFNSLATNIKTACPQQTKRIAQHNKKINVRLYSSSQVLRPYVDPKLSYAYGRSQENLIYSTVAREFDRQVSQNPDGLAFVSHSERITRTHSQLDQDVRRVAKALVGKFNVQKGDIVGVFAYNCYNWILVQYACSRIGAILTPINPSYKADELAYVLNKGRVKCLFMPGPKSIQRELNDHLDVLNSQPVIDIFASNPKPKLESVILMDGENEYDLSHNQATFPFKLAKHCKLFHWSHVEDNDGLVFRSAQEADEAGVALDEACILSPELVSPDDLFAIYYTSGTTGKPKGACCSQFTVINNVRLCQIRLRHGRPRNWYVICATTLPLFHIFAGVLNALSPIVSMSSVVLASHKYDIGTFVDSIQQHQANITTLTPTMLIDMLTYIEQQKIRDFPLKVIQPGGASLAPELVARAFKALPHLEEIRTGYGSTENGAVATFQTIHEPEATRAHTVGPPLDFTEVRVVKPSEGGECVPLGEKGEIQTRGHNTMIEYLDEPGKTREVITENRWYRTGDIGFMHPHGSIVISGRIKHMIIKGGENIYPEEVEQMILKLECIEKVHVVGVPDKRFGEQVCAWVKLKPGYSEWKGKFEDKPADDKLVHRENIVAFCKQNITYFKVPKFCLFVDDFPMTPTKKVQNHVMVEQSIKMLGLEKQETVSS